MTPYTREEFFKVMEFYSKNRFVMKGACRFDFRSLARSAISLTTVSAACRLSACVCVCVCVLPIAPRYGTAEYIYHLTGGRPAELFKYAGLM
jgi:hypothetical protein